MNTLAHASSYRQRLLIRIQELKIEVMVGILIIDKPVGLTSHDVVARVRRILKEKRVGHTGTLDPFATGVLVVLVGRATRLAQFLNTSEKEYEGVIRFGYSTDTGDATGAVRPETRTKATSKEFAEFWTAATIEEALATLHGNIEQVPPMYSAKKVKGRKLYELARKGEEVERKPVPVTIFEFEVMQLDDELLEHNADGTCDMAVRVVCSAGTYIRTLAESVGEKMGIAAHLAELRRTRAGDFHVRDARTLDELDELVTSDGDASRALLPLSAALPNMRSIRLADDVAQRVRHGATVQVKDRFQDSESVQMNDTAGELIAIGAYDPAQQALRPRIVFASEE